MSNYRPTMLSFTKGLVMAAWLLGIPVFSAAQEVKYTVGKPTWMADSLGNHRAAVAFNGNGNIARVLIPWRRRDESPEKKRIIVQDARTGKKITNVAVMSINREQGDICFEPVSGKGYYYIYYLPYKNEGSSNYPK